MVPSTFLTLALSCAAGALAMLLAPPGTAWADNHRWLLPVLEWATGVFFVLSLLSTKAARKILSGFVVTEDRKDVHQESEGDYSPNLSGVMVGRDLIVGGSPPTPARKPHFAFDGLGYARLCTGGPEHGFSVETDQRHADRFVHSVTLKFRNVPMGDSVSATAGQVVARMTFYSKDWRKKLPVDYGLWLDAAQAHVEIGVGDTRELVLLIYWDQKCPRTVRDFRHHNRPLVDRTYYEEPPVEWFQFVEVTLTDQLSHVEEMCLLTIWPCGGVWCSAAKGLNENPYAANATSPRVSMTIS
jgi:hypothetical protein